MIPPATFSKELADYLSSISPQTLESFEKGLAIEKRTSVRVNTLKSAPEKIRKTLEAAGFKVQPLEFYRDAWRIEEEPTLISKTLEHFLGLIYIQGVASMMPPLVLNPTSTDLVLDISAAPGSKTTQLAQMMGNKGCLVANDWDGKRIKTLSHNLDRMGIINAAMVHMPGERIGTILPEVFDKVLVDAPCSALGVIHKAPEAVENLKFVQKYAFIQEQLLISALKAVKTGGKVVYSTCTVSPDENEKLIEKMLHKYPIELEQISIDPSIRSMEGITSHTDWVGDPTLKQCVRLVPSEINPEGFFVATVRKKGPVEGQPAKREFPNPKNHHELTGPDNPTIRQMGLYFEDRFGIPASIWDQYLFHIKEEEILVTSAEWSGREDLLNRIFTHRVGTRIARTRRAGEWKLSTNAAQLFADHIHDNLIPLSEPSDIETYLAAGMIRKSFGIESGGVVVSGNGYVLGCGVIHQGALKSQMPKSRKVLAVDIY
ncbi:MAG: RsmB/NOP family class I SAM-dependent RNA methyltransferase [Bacteroidetes bacterium]|nr:RsmB/NOP family class I SAM-dependent RNA methyltransferase [Bacteroidota bacterium]